MDRDFEKNPYNADEKRVCDYLVSLTPDLGCGDDPISFLIASHAALSARNRRAQELHLEGRLSTELWSAIVAAGPKRG